MHPEGPCLYVHGRLRGVPRARLENALGRIGTRLSTRLSTRVDWIVVAHSAAARILDNEGIRESVRSSWNTLPVSEHALKRRLGLMPASGDEDRTFDRSVVLKASGLSLDLLIALELFDVIEARDAHYSFGDVAAAREVARLLRDGFRLSEVVEAAGTLRRHGRSLSDTKLAEGDDGELAQMLLGRRGRLDGQLDLGLPTGDRFIDIVERAEVAEAADELEEAARWYAVAASIDPTDAALPYNLGNVLDGLSRSAEAILAYRRAIALDPAFVEAWHNLALALERAGRNSDAVAAFEKALEINPDFGEAVYGLALRLTEDGALDRAASLWDRFLLGGDRPLSQTKTARRLRAACRMALIA